MCGTLTVMLKLSGFSGAVAQTQIVGICCILEPQRFVDLVAVLTGNQTLVSRLWKGQEFCFLRQTRVPTVLGSMAHGQFFPWSKPHTGGKKLNLNNQNHFLTFVPTLDRSAWSPSAGPKDMNNKPGLCLTANKPGSANPCRSVTQCSLCLRVFWGTVKQG